MQDADPIHEESLPDPDQSDGSPKAQLKGLRERIRRLGEHLQENPDDRKARRALDRALRKKRSLRRYIEGSD
ncbi:30S ribosomal protein S15 [Salinibacter sp.]|uniref:30S ribosomal protein S15 n=1 Tax=Salinibacter sp. TaxID=2065818 RepID=UPI003D6F6FC8